MYLLLSLLSLSMAIELFIIIIIINIIMFTAMFYHSGLFRDHLNIVVRF